LTTHAAGADESINFIERQSTEVNARYTRLLFYVILINIVFINEKNVQHACNTVITATQHRVTRDKTVLTRQIGSKA